ncbi:MAG: T9SS type A sorting domain-containing protein [Saprospiraceae bacterium]
MVLRIRALRYHCCFPNPSSGRIFVQIQSVANTSVQMKLYDIDGKFIGTVLDSEMNAGKQSFEVNLPKLPAGAYKYSITTTAGVENGDLILHPDDATCSSFKGNMKNIKYDF